MYCVIDHRGWYYSFREYTFQAVADQYCFTADYAFALGIADAYGATVLNA